jgi:hypothetical protein
MRGISYYLENYSKSITLGQVKKNFEIKISGVYTEIQKLDLMGFV